MLKFASTIADGKNLQVTSDGKSDTFSIVKEGGEVEQVLTIPHVFVSSAVDVINAYNSSGMTATKEVVA